jgi:hypothetical protein
MNCENCQELIHDFLDGSISQSDELALNTHLQKCLDCDSVRQDLSSILGFCRSHRGEYETPPNTQALWLRIRNVIEAEGIARPEVADTRKPFFSGLLSRSWQLSLPQLVSSVVAIVVLVSLATVVGIRRWGMAPAPAQNSQLEAYNGNANINDRVWQRQQVINYWNQRVELNKARWNPAMRETFDRNMAVIDQAVSESMNELNRNPHDDIAEQMLNESLNDKLALLKEFSDL